MNMNQRRKAESSIADSYNTVFQVSVAGERRTVVTKCVTYCNDMLASLRITPSSFNRRSPTKVYSRSTYTGF